MTATAADEDAARLAPYLPRLVVEWARDAPETLWREVDGTMAFVDVSGFTALSERLAELGKAGAEEMTDVMNATLSRLLEVAYAGGGSLLKFGGDALLLLFTGTDHQTRAARAAFRMRRALREHGRPRTSRGSVTLRMHVGMHAGTFRFFLVGGHHRELVVTGEAATRTAAMEDASEAGEILLTPEAAAALPERCVARTEAGYLLRADPPGPDEAVETVPHAAGVDLAPYISAALRPLAGAAVEPEHRLATIAFLQYSGVDALLAEAGPDEVARRLDDLVREVQSAAAEHEVAFLETDIAPDGGKIVLTAGAPATTGADEERMLRTLRRVLDAGLELPVRAGVSRGRVFAGEIGTPFRRAYTVLGGTAALAARLTARAAAGTVLATREVVERSATSFETRECEPFLAKGIAEPVRALEVGAVAGAREAEAAPLLPLVGRERELAVLGAALAPVRMGFGSFVELVGEAGVGKSRLVDELAAQASDLRGLRAACAEYEASTPYYAFRGLLRSLLDVPVGADVATTTERLTERVEAVAPELVPWLPLIAIPLDVPVAHTREVDELEPPFRRARLHGVVEQLLAALLGDPTSIVIEDVHWMDDASSDLLRHLGAHASSKPWLEVTTRRPGGGGFAAAEGTPPVPAMTLRLEPLSADAARALAAAAAGGAALAPHELDALAERAGGNPLFLQELVAATTREAAGDELPESVGAMVGARIDELAPADRTLLRYASVLGSTFDAALVGEVLEHEEAVAADEEAWDRLGEFVERDPYTAGSFRFRHALFRDAAYEGLSFRRRRELHERVAAAYARRHGGRPEAVAELLSLHYGEAQRWDRAYEFALVAGRRAQAKYANVEAATFYRRAIDAARRLDDVDAATQAGLWEALGDVSELAGAYDDAGAAYRQARALAEADPAVLVGLLRKEGIIRERTGRYSEALRWYSRGLRAASALQPDLQRHHRIELSLAYAGVRFRQGLLAECIEWCDRVVEEAAAAQYLPGLAHAYYLLHLAYTSLGSPEREAYRGLALPIYEEIGDLSGQAGALNNMGIDAYYEGRWDEALTLYRRAREARERIGDVVGAARIANNIGEIKADQGYYDAARKLFEEAAAVAASAGYRLMELVTRSNLGRTAARDGRTDDALPLLEDAKAGFAELGATAFLLEADARIAELALLAGDGEHAFALATDAVLSGGDPVDATVVGALLHRIRGYGLAQTGDRDGAVSCLEQSLAIAEAANAEYEVALTLEALERLEARAPGGAHAILARLGVIATPTVPLPL